MVKNKEEFKADKELFIKQIDEHKQISMTGSRALVLLILLITGPKNFQEIKQYIVDCGIVEKEYSIDTIRIDINTLKAVGCEITKATKKTNHKYGLISHPFTLVLTNKEVTILKSVYRKLAKKASPLKLVKFHRIFEKIAKMVKDEDIRQQILGISLLKKSDINLLEELVADETRYNKIRIEYNPSSHAEPVEYDFSPEKFEIRSGKLYVFGYNHTLGGRSFLPVSRIKSIICKMFDRTTSYGLDTIITFRLNNYKNYSLEENEVVIETKDDAAIIEGHYFNEFIGIQRMLFFASDCTVIKPDEIKQTIINKLKEMREIYE